MIDKNRLAEIRARAEAATAGPWWWDEDGHKDGWCYPPYGADREFIAHARQDIPDLLAEVERLLREGAPRRCLCGEEATTCDAWTCSGWCHQ